MRILFDTASTSTFITVSACNKIKHKVLVDDITLNITSMKGTENQKSKLVSFELEETYYHSNVARKFIIQAYVVKELMTLPGHSQLPFYVYSTLYEEKVTTTDKFPRNETPIDILFGITDTMRFIIEPPRRIAKQVYLLPTVWGEAICGSVHFDCLDLANHRYQIDDDDKSYIFDDYSYATNTERLAQACEKLWKLEELPHDNSTSSLTKDEVIEDKELFINQEEADTRMFLHVKNVETK